MNLHTTHELSLCLTDRKYTFIIERLNEYIVIAANKEFLSMSCTLLKDSGSLRCMEQSMRDSINWNLLNISILHWTVSKSRFKSKFHSYAMARARAIPHLQLYVGRFATFIIISLFILYVFQFDASWWEREKKPETVRSSNDMRIVHVRCAYKMEHIPWTIFKRINVKRLQSIEQTRIAVEWLRGASKVA